MALVPRILPQISKIVMENFLNFAREEIVLDPRFTVITGPNGSGKSSIFQGIKFALGSNDRDERYPKWADFIHFDQNYARVELEILNAGNNYGIRRTVIQNGKITYDMKGPDASDFTPVPKAQVDLLVGSFGYNPRNIFAFVSQGRIDVIKNMDPRGLCAYVEEGLGLSQLRQQIEQEEERLQYLDNDLNELRQRRGTYEMQLEMLRPKLERLARKREINALIAQLREEYLLANRKQVINDIETNKEKKCECLDQAQLLEGQLTQAKECDDQIAAKIDQIDERLNLLFERTGAIKNDYALVEGEIHSWEQGRQDLIYGLRTVEAEFAEKEANFTQKSQIEEKVREKLDAISTLVEETRARYADLLTERDGIQQTLGQYVDWQAKYNRVRDELNANEDYSAELTQKIEDLVKQSAEILDQISQVDYQCSKIYKVLDKWDENFQKNFPTLRASLRKSIFEQETALRESETQKEKCLDDLSRYEKAIAGKESVYPREIRQIKAEIERRNWPVKGPLIEIMHFDPLYSQAIESIFGKAALYCFIAFDRESFILLMELRKNTRAFCKIFLPKPGRVASLPPLPHREGVIGYLYDLILVEEEGEEVRKAIHAIVNDAIVVERPTVALDLHNAGVKARCVTLDGEILISHDRAEESRPTKHLRDHVNIQQLKGKVEAAQKEVDRVQREIDAGTSNRDALRAKFDRLEKLGMVIPKLQELCQQKEDYTAQNHHMNEEKARFEQELAGVLQEISDQEQQIYDLEQEIAVDVLDLQERNKVLPVEIEECLINLNAMAETKEGTAQDFQTAHQATADIQVEVELSQQNVDAWRIDIETRDNEIIVKHRELRKLEKAVKKCEENITTEKGCKDQAIQEKKLSEEEFFALKVEQDRWQASAGKLEETIIELEQALRHIMETLANNPDLDQVQHRPMEDIQDDLTRATESLQEFYDVDDSLETYRDEILESIQRVQESRDQITDEITAAAGVIEQLQTEFFAKMTEVLGELETRMNEKFQKYGINYHCALTLEGNFSTLEVCLTAGAAGHPLTAIAALSGGQRTMVAINLVLALQSFNPSPLIIFDEAEMFLDKKNAAVVSQIVGETTCNGVQIVMLMPDASKGLITLADKVIGVALSGPDGPSTIVPDPQVLRATGQEE
ncbi:MAG TPA: AAA family ATPase [Candidatus Lokiarchaeia archaeon]|nr:AAA family ATPase [Candidatus Lokiarchaeia archaeon]